MSAKEIAPRSIARSMTYPEKYLARQHRYNVSAKGRARAAPYNASDKGVERWLRYRGGVRRLSASNG